MKKINTLIFYTLLILIISSSAFAQAFDGYALYNSGNSTTTYLIDQEGDIAKTWSCDYQGNYAVLLMENGNLMRGAVNPNNQINGAAVGGRVQEIDPNGDIVWDFIYSSATYVSHHDITLMPNGGVLLTAWEVKTNTEMVEAGYDGNGQKYPTHFVEVQHDGNGGGQIVWEWHLFDHLIQDHDASKDNFGVVADHPELLDINVSTGGGMGGPGGGGDWIHTNGVNYNAELDQIVFSSRFLSEIFVIDHSTTMEEAAGHTGGNSGKGGDFLYRWGNPDNYGAPGAQTIPGPVHDVRWITNDGRPNGGYLQFFNNDGAGNLSTIDAINPPLSADGYNYDLTAGESYGPDAYDWRHVCEDYAWGQSASDRMPNGNTFVNMSGEYMYEADENDNIVWQYSAGPQKAFRYTCDHPGIQALIAAGEIDDIYCSIVDVNEINTYDVDVFPNPTNGMISIEGLPTGDEVEIVVTDIYGKQVARTTKVSTIDLSSNANGVYLLTFQIGKANPFTKKVSVIK